MADMLPQEFPRELALLRLEDVLPEMAPSAREAYAEAFEQRRSDPLDSRGLTMVGQGGVRPLMASMRLTVLRFRDLNFERFDQFGGKERLLSAYVKGANLSPPLPGRASALFIERADQVSPGLATDLLALPIPIFCTWEGDLSGPVWAVLQERCEVIRL